MRRIDTALAGALVRDRRFVLGIVGAPGAGKSTVSEALAARYGDDCAIVPMDGFHLAAAAIAGTEAAARRGAPDTFDPVGFVTLLTRIRLRTEPVVHAPVFDRRIEDPVHAGVAVRRETPLVVVEGNYLLGDGDWAPVRELLDETWFVTRPDDQRMDDLAARHHRHGKSTDAARAWATGPDEANARLVAATAHRADRVLDLVAGTLSPPSGGVGAPRTPSPTALDGPTDRAGTPPTAPETPADGKAAP